MIKLRYYKDLLFCELDCKLNNQNIHLKNVLIDTGSATTLINADHVLLDGTEIVDEVRGVGGSEKILTKQYNILTLNGHMMNNAFLSIGDMDYGIDIDLLLGLDILKDLNADISLKNMCIEFKQGCDINE